MRKLSKSLRKLPSVETKDLHAGQKKMKMESVSVAVIFH